MSDTGKRYLILSPAILCCRKANSENQKEKNDLLKRILIGNILSMSKYLDLQLEQDQKINADLQFKQTKVTLKGQQMIGFKGMFKTIWDWVSQCLAGLEVLKKSYEIKR